MLEDKERKLKELRTHEAMKKKLMGPGGKFGVIVKNLGHKIVAHNTSAFFDSRHVQDAEWDSPYDYEFDSGHIYDGEEDDSIGVKGWHFDGLSRGVHLEIRYLDGDKELSVYYKGYLVYREASGDLRAYSPKDEWEEKVEWLYKTAAVVKAERQKSSAEDDRAEKKKDWLDRVNELRLRWGL